jgi:histidine triad (HIT) family protein
MNNCVFCQIVAGKKQAHVVYEDNRFVSFLDIRPLTKGNALVVPREHITWPDDVPEFGDYFEVARKIGKAAQRALGSKWTQYLTIGHEIPHAHIRVIPRYPDDLHGPVPNLALIEQLSEKEMAVIAERIRKEIKSNS